MFEFALKHVQEDIWALGKVDGAFSLELLKSVPFPDDLKALDEDGIRQIWPKLSSEDAAIAGQ